MSRVNRFDVIALNVDISEEALHRGQVGTVFEVEFSGLDGMTYAMSVLRANQLMVLHYAPATVS